MVEKTDMRETLMAMGKAVVQARGYGSLSFRELAKTAGIKDASVHYHFPTKADLGAALARRYTDDGAAYLAGLLERSSDPSWCMDQYALIFRSALEHDNRMCLCGIMSAELDTLPERVREEVEAFGVANVDWITRVLELAEPGGDPIRLHERAMAIFAAFEGAQLVARGRQDISVFDRAISAFRTTGLIP